MTTMGEPPPDELLHTDFSFALPFLKRAPPLGKYKTTDRQSCTLLFGEATRKSSQASHSFRLEPVGPSPVRHSHQDMNLVASRLLVQLTSCGAECPSSPVLTLVRFSICKTASTRSVLTTFTSLTGSHPPCPAIRHGPVWVLWPSALVDGPLRVQLYRLPHFCGHHHRSHVAMEASPAPLSVAPFPVPHEVDFHHFNCA